MATLNDKQALFCQEYLVDLCAVEAYTRAGYSPRGAKQSAHKLLQRPAVQARIQELLAARSQRTEITADYVLANLAEVVERCMQRAPVMVRRGREMVQLEDADGNDVWQFDAQGAIGATRILAQHLGMIGNRPQLTVNADLDKLTDEQLEHLAKGGSLDGLPR